MVRVFRVLTVIFICSFFGHKKRNNKCLRCKQQFGVPKMSNHPEMPKRRDLIVDYIETPMIQLNEIREGNLVYEFGKVHTISFKDDDHWHLENFQPIPLTPEILRKCGFEANNGKRLINDVWLVIHENEANIYDLYKNETVQMRIELKYLHQLQNLYFALTQTELNIQL
jgi:hypothetical protein